MAPFSLIKQDLATAALEQQQANQKVQEIVDQASKDASFTPDLWYLERFEWQLLFVCDQWKAGHIKNDLIANDGEKLCDALSHDNFTFYKKKLGLASYGIPLPMPVPKEYFGPIRGELWKVRPYLFKILDSEKDNGYSFVRKRVSLSVPFFRVYDDKERNGKMSEHDTTVEAWMYIGKPEYWAKQLDGGYMFETVKVQKPNKSWRSDYYMFSPEDYGV